MVVPPGVFRQLASVIHDTKRGTRPRGLESWFPYYAGFSEQWASLALGSLKLPHGATLLDPWNGSGTTTLIASRLGLEAVGVDINPVAALVAAAKLANPKDIEHHEGIVTQIVTNARLRPYVGNAKDPLRTWLSRELVRAHRALLGATLSLLAQRQDGSTVNPLVETPPPIAAFFILCLLRAARRVARMKPASNPTWQRPARVSRVGEKALIEGFRTTVRQFSAQLCASPFESADQTIMIGDARALRIDDDSVDAVLTSPPYCTRLDYVVGVQFELAAIGAQTEAYVSLRRDSMGTALMRQASHSIHEFGPLAKTLLTSIRDHSSKDSSSYYLSSYLQYFADMRRALAEISRVLRPGGAAVLVLQTSYYKEIAIDLSGLYLEMGKILNMRGVRVHRQPVKRVLTDINQGALRHLSKRAYFEDVIAMKVKY